jgi:hypothetical protein
LGEPTWQTHRGSWRSPTQKISDFEVATMLLSEQELVMGKPQKKYDPSQEQEQAQANLQAQLQGQGQGQLQGQGQGQLAVQSLDSSSENENSNNNKNSNDNKNSNKNDLSNEVDNKTSNKTDNSTENNVDNKLSNKVDNNIENTIDNKVNVDVNVDLDLSLKATGLSSPVIDLHNLDADQSLVMPQVVNQTLNGNGNQFDINQVNNLYDNGHLTSPSVSYSGPSAYEPGGGFSMEAKIDGGESKIDGAHMGDAAGAGAGIVSHADATLTQSAFDQTITQGANIQFNSVTMEVAGSTLTDHHDVLGGGNG